MEGAMSKFAWAGLLAGGSMLAAGAFLAGALAQTAASPPDFWSAGTSWSQGNGVNFMPVPGSVPPIVNDPAHPHYSNGEAIRRGIQPTYRIADLTNANIKQWAKDVMKKDNDEVLAGKFAYTPGSSCKPAGTPVFMLDGGPFYFVQTAKEVLIVASEDSQVRHVYMNVPHTRNPKPSWYGESVGHYEGDTLVVDTIGLSPKAVLDNYHTPHTEQLHVIERYHVVDGGKKLQVDLTIDDPGAFNAPYKAVQTYDRTMRGPLPEVKCSENNDNIFNLPGFVGSPESSKPDF